MAVHLPEKKRKNTLRNVSHYVSLAIIVPTVLSACFLQEI